MPCWGETRSGFSICARRTSPHRSAKTNRCLKVCLANRAAQRFFAAALHGLCVGSQFLQVHVAECTAKALTGIRVYLDDSDHGPTFAASVQARQFDSAQNVTGVGSA